ncbi:hypothetical protein A2765_03305 [Candidatus Kaiserbacteria bacterium RIFCSPHIGHO2_01_FULL_56_24]|uniref:Uncharacterized protein n=1 Tax=Candidatus Kaiserbacteria bacterium RIFCSPHIGHO2_01_FULL_56_24 TaxID=1798487 RepID=A0A1F6DBA9_9BACT|nr:MAG: hypothetical protein A2765_03305 [Candidatus Kaiserbacteria bacterium RIFCSPHIGHO2_01_FULL_56_24]
MITFIADNMWLWLLVSLCSVGFILHVQSGAFKKYGPRLNADLNRGLSRKQAEDALRERLVRDGVANDRTSKTVVRVAMLAFILFVWAVLIRLAT